MSTDSRYNKNILFPKDIDQSELLLCSNSFRALFFDTKGVPLLIEFLTKNDIDIEIETFETDLNLLLLSILITDDIHVSDFFAEVIINPKFKLNYPLDTPKQVACIFQDGKGFEGPIKNTDIWIPKSKTVGVQSSSVGISYQTQAPFQLINFTRKRIPVSQWGKVKIGYLKDIAITRENIITYVANKLGGVHYDSKRRPSGIQDKEAFKVLAEAYDWGDQAIIHAGFIAIGLACLEILNTPDLIYLHQALEKFHSCRQERLQKGESLS